MSIRVVMAVNNPATNDYRVVKSAEMVARAGFDCHVVGVMKHGYKENEIINGVTYHRVNVKPCLTGFIAGVSIKAFLFFNKEVSITENVGQSNKKNRKNRLMSLPFIKLVNDRVWLLKKQVKNSTPSFYKIILPFHIPLSSVLKCIRKTVSSVLKFIRKVSDFTRYVLNKILSLIKRKLRPEHSSIGVKYLQGNYLAGFYNKLLILNADIYHAHELWMLESCSLVSTLLGKKLIYDSHELEVHRNNSWSSKSNKTRCGYEEQYINSASSVFAVSNGCAREIEKQYGLKEVLLLRNTPLLSSLKTTNKKLRETLKIDVDTKVLIYTGSVTFNRGLDVVLKALVHLQDYVLVTVGPWNERVKNELECSAIELKVKGRFFMHNKVSPQELISLISGGDIAVIPIRDACLSYRYCMPNKLFEAAFAGLPIVASDLPDMKEFIVDNDLGFTFENDNEDSLINAIKNIERNNYHLKVQGNCEKISKEYCFEKESEILINKYYELIGAPNSAVNAAA